MFYNAALVEQNSLFCQNFHSLFQPFCWCQIWSIKYHWSLTLCFVLVFLLCFFLNFRFVSYLLFCFCFHFAKQKQVQFPHIHLAQIQEYISHTVLDVPELSSMISPKSLIKHYLPRLFLLMFPLLFFLQFQASLFQYFIVIVNRANEFHLISRQFSWWLLS